MFLGDFFDDVPERKAKTASTVDHDWYSDGLVVDGELTHDQSQHPRDNDKKDDLQLEWGYGDIGPDYDEFSYGVDRHNEDFGDAGPVIRFSRQLLNAGRTAHGISMVLREKFPDTTIEAANDELKELFALEGLIGHVMVDARGIGCREAVAQAEKSPYKQFINYVIGCECGSHEMLTADSPIIESNIEPGACSVDDILVANPIPENGKFAIDKLCRTTLKKVIGGQQDLSDEFMERTLIDLISLGHVTSDEAKAISEREGKAAFERIRAAFRLIREKARAEEKAQYAGEIDVSSHVVEQSDNEIEFDAQAKDGLDIALFKASDESDVDFDPTVASPQIEEQDPKLALEISEPADHSEIDVEHVGEMRF